MIRITYEFATEDEALRFLARDKVQVQPSVINIQVPKPKAAKKATALASQAVTEPCTAPSSAATLGGVAPEPVKAAPKAPNAPVQAVAEVNEAAVRAALREVENTRSMKIAADILKGFSATSVSQIKPEQYADFIKACGK